MEKPSSNLRVERPASLRSQVQDILRASILNGDFAVGEHLIERELCQATQVSRPILREALVHLEARGLIQQIPARGYVVVRLEPSRVAAIYEVRGALEGLAARCFAQRGRTEDLRALKAAFAALSKAAKKADRAAIRDTTTTFYDVLMDRCGNPEIRSALEPVLDRIAFLRSKSMEVSGRREESVNELERLVDAISAGDADAASRISDEHIQTARDAAISRLEMEG